jgi:hypothetical protein
VSPALRLAMLGRYGMVPAAACLALFGWELSSCYSRVYAVARYAAWRRGVRWDAAPAWPSPAAALPPAAAAATGDAVSLGPPALCDRILLTRTPHGRALLGAASAAAAARPRRLSPAALWATVRPARASAASWRALVAARGLATLSSALAAAWAACVAPLAHAAVGAALCPRGEPRPHARAAG